MYTLDITEHAKKQLEKLPAQHQEAILQKLKNVRSNPFRYVKKLTGNKLWRLRIQDYRAILDIIVSGKKIIVLRIGHRRNIYD